MQKKDLESMDQSARAYFDTLPAALQGQIMQSGIVMTSKEQLEKYCRNALAPNAQDSGGPKA